MQYECECIKHVSNEVYTLDKTHVSFPVPFYTCSGSYEECVRIRCDPSLSGGVEGAQQRCVDKCADEFRCDYIQTKTVDYEARTESLSSPTSGVRPSSKKKSMDDDESSAESFLSIYSVVWQVFGMIVGLNFV